MSRGYVRPVRHACHSKEVRAKAECSDDIVETTCLFDDTLQKRGFSSLISVVTCISAVNYKVLEIEDLRGNTAEAAQK